MDAIRFRFSRIMNEYLGFQHSACMSTNFENARLLYSLATVNLGVADEREQAAPESGASEVQEEQQHEVEGLDGEECAVPVDRMTGRADG